MQEQTIQINCLETHQIIEGFGCFGGREKDFFQDPKRDAIMEELFGQLRLSILRTEAKPSFSTVPGEINFDMNADLTIPPNDAYFDKPDQDEVKRRSQLWVLKNSKKYNPKIVASTWSPPHYMKTKTLKRLKSASYADFANFLADYVKAYQLVNIPIFAISPQNEPENIFSPWDVCLWLPWETVNFVNKYMRPIFNQRGLTATKIMVGESANWTVNKGFLLLMNNKKNMDIVASHGYTVPDPLDNLSVTYNTDPIGDVPADWKKSVWISEVCSIKSFDPSMTMGLQAAICLHKFLAVKNVNASIFWLGMVRGNSNEALICSDGLGNYQLTKAFDTLGNFSKYINAGDIRIATNSATLNSTIYVSAFKQANSEQLSIVVINASNETVRIHIQLNHADSVQTLIPYETPPELGVRWEQKDAIQRSANQFTTYLIPQSVTTFLTNSGQ
jgi:glucuronoarabinoxylan endo-1,4-beta-xylanase